MNIQFSYLYRDGANYKQYHSEVFSNKNGLSLLAVENVIRASLIEDNWFYVDKWKLKDLHFHIWDNEIDHTWHEYDTIQETNDDVTMNDISDFLILIQAK